MTQYVPVIGLEIHAELATQSKLFCRCPNTSSELGTPPNTAICPVCIGLPGALPVMNKAAIEATLQLGQALQSSSPETVKWDRKNYFYPDLPKGYQISQYDEPLCSGGTLRWFDRSGEAHAVALTRVHLEEDTGKLTHPDGADYSLIDYNRSSIPLLELVTEPEITSAKQAKECAEAYQHLLRELGVAEASMEKGEMRCEANISIIPEELSHDQSQRLTGVKVEIKNLNSFRSMERAILYEIERQTKALQDGTPLRQETRGWNETKGETYVMRAKETSDDYRYFPEPDLLPLDLKPYQQSERPVLPTHYDLFKQLLDLKISPAQVHMVVTDPARLSFFQSLVDADLAADLYPLAVQWIAGEPKLFEFTLEEVKQVLQLLFDQSIRPSALKEGLSQATSGNLLSVVTGLTESFSVADLDQVVVAVLADHPGEVAQYKEGKQQLFGFFVGLVRKALDGKGDPVAIAQAIRNQLQ